MQTITTSWFVQGMIKATSDAWLKGWDERNGGNLTLRLDDGRPRDWFSVCVTCKHMKRIPSGGRH